MHAAEIGVTAKDGVVTLTGTVDNYVKKTEAEDATKKVAGVTAVVEKIEVRFNNSWSKSDNEIADEVVSALKWNWQVPHENLKIKVEAGWVTLEGELKWDYQRVAAKESAANQPGVKGVSNNITIKAESKDEIEEKEIKSALGRHWSIKSDLIKVSVSGTKVTLTGSVDSWYQKEEAERIVWKAPGVWSIDNELLVEYDYSMVD